MDRQENNTFGVDFDKRVRKVVEKFLKTSSFTDRKLTDTPTDDLQVVNRRFATMNGATGSRPTSPVVGQFYFDTSLGFPVWYDGTNWVDGSGTPS